MLTKIWGCGVYTGPEILDKILHFHSPRKSENFTFAEIRLIGVYTWSRKSVSGSSVVITRGPENLNDRCLHVVQKI